MKSYVFDLKTDKLYISVRQCERDLNLTFYQIEKLPGFIILTHDQLTESVSSYIGIKGRKKYAEAIKSCGNRKKIPATTKAKDTRANGGKANEVSGDGTLPSDLGASSSGPHN